MRSRWFALLIPIAVLAGCAGGSTIRMAEDDESTAEPVSLAPAPEADPSSRTDAAAPAPLPDSSVQAPPLGEQGYAPYGNASSPEIRRIGKWSHTGIGEARRLVIRDANAWAAFWSELGAGDRPDVDFTQNVVIVAAAGQRRSGGHEIAVDRVNQADGQLTIEVLETTPGPNCLTTGAVTQPVDVVVVPVAAPRGWSFLERKEIRGCN
jgi:PrcB C-terminal